MIECEGKKHPAFHLDRCVFCYLCAQVCPQRAISNTGYFEMATTDKSTLLVDPQVCTYSIMIQIDKKPKSPLEFGTYKKNNDNRGET
jgi:formate hydrogenlyase subunit 6/NADH:ubiquinone oxidoreductase subunit I